MGKGNQLINYRHIIHSLVRKPGAFSNYRYREQMFPSLTFRVAYDRLRENSPARSDSEYLRILKLAADNLECDVEAALNLLLDTQAVFNSQAVAELVATGAENPVPVISQDQPCLLPYNELLSGGLRERLAA